MTKWVIQVEAAGVLYWWTGSTFSSDPAERVLFPTRVDASITAVLRGIFRGTDLVEIVEVTAE